MKIELYKRHIKLPQTSEHTDIKEGKYNEFYLPSVDINHELWIRITDDNGVETKIHLKR